MWTELVDLVRATILSGATVLGGSLGASILVVSTLIRLAMLPLALRSARLARAQQEALLRIRPELERLKQRHARDPRRLMEETRALYLRNGIRVAAPAALLSMALQIPLLGALFSAVRTGLGTRVRFGWIADLSRGDAMLVILVSTLAGMAAALGPAVPGASVSPRAMTWVVVAGTLLFLWSASSAVALSVGAGSAVSVLQNWLLRREAGRGSARAVTG